MSHEPLGNIQKATEDNHEKHGPVSIATSNYQVINGSLVHAWLMVALDDKCCKITSIKQTVTGAGGIAQFLAPQFKGWHMIVF